MPSGRSRARSSGTSSPKIARSAALSGPGGVFRAKKPRSDPPDDGAFDHAERQQERAEVGQALEAQPGLLDALGELEAPVTPGVLVDLVVRAPEPPATPAR